MLKSGNWYNVFINTELQEGTAVILRNKQLINLLNQIDPLKITDDSIQIEKENFLSVRDEDIENFENFKHDESIYFEIKGIIHKFEYDRIEKSEEHDDYHYYKCENFELMIISES